MAHNFLSTVFTDAVRRAQETYYGRAQTIPPAPGADELGEQEQAFIQRRDSFYLASVNADWRLWRASSVAPAPAITNSPSRLMTASSRSACTRM